MPSIVYSGSYNSIATFDNVAGANNAFLANEIEDMYNSHIDLSSFCTVDNNLVGTPGTEVRINTYGASGDAEDVAEGAGNSSAISTSLTEKFYRIKTAQVWFRYTDEAYQRDPVAISTGIARMGIALFDKVNADIFGEYAGAFSGDNPSTRIVEANYPDFDAFVDAQSLMDIKDVRGEVAMDAQMRFAPTTFAFLAKNDIAKARKKMKDQIVYDPNYAWLTGYVGTVAGTTLIYKQDATEGTIYVATKEAVTIFNKTGVELETAARSGGAEGTANTRYNDMFARKYYIAALTDVSKLSKIVLPVNGSTGATGETA